MPWHSPWNPNPNLTRRGRESTACSNLLTAYLLPACLPACLPEAAVSVLRDLSCRLRQRDPESQVEAAPDGDSGRFVINSVRYNSRVLRWLGKVDGDTDVFALQRVVQSSLSPSPLYDMKNHVTTVAH